MTKHLCLFSGGKDSLVATHYAHQHFPIDGVVYLDTNTGLPANLEYVKKTCDRHGWDLQIRKSPMTLRDFVKRYGFAGPSVHSWAYRYFKDRQLQKMATEYDNPVYYSGVRQNESNRRMKTVSGKYLTDQRWTWVSPIWDFSTQDCEDYIKLHELETNPLYETIGRSGDCYCGAYAHRTSELGRLKEYHPSHYKWITDLEQEAKQWDLDKARRLWGWGGLTKQELRSQVAMNDDKQMMLCADCDVGL